MLIVSKNASYKNKNLFSLSYIVIIYNILADYLKKYTDSL